MRIYIAGPYSAPTEEERLANVTRACQVAAALILKGIQAIAKNQYN